MGKNKPKYGCHNTKQTSYIGQKVKNSPKRSLDIHFLIWFTDMELSIRTILCRVNKLLFLCSFNVDTWGYVLLWPWPEAFICFQCVLCYVEIGVNCNFVIDHIVVFILEVEFDWFKFGWVNQFVDEVIVDVEGSIWVEIGLKINIINAALTIASLNMNSNITE